MAWYVHCVSSGVTDSACALFGRVPVTRLRQGQVDLLGEGWARELRRCFRRGEGDEAESDRFLSVLFPASQLQVLAYNRVVRDLNGLDTDGFLRAAGDAYIGGGKTRDASPRRSASDSSRAHRRRLAGARSASAARRA